MDVLPVSYISAASKLGLCHFNCFLKRKLHVHFCVDRMQTIWLSLRKILKYLSTSLGLMLTLMHKNRWFALTVAAWCGGNTLVAVHWARILLGWVTVCWQVNCLGTYPTTWVKSAFHHYGVGKSCTSLSGWGTAGHVHLAGNTVWSHIASDTLQLWDNLFRWAVSFNCVTVNC